MWDRDSSLFGKMGECFSMNSSILSAIQRRDFLKLVGSATVCGLTHTAVAAPAGRVTIVVDPDIAADSIGPVHWAASRLQKALAQKSVDCKIATSMADAAGSSFCVVVAANNAKITKGFGS